MTDVMKQLQAPFKPDEIEWRVGSTTNDKTQGLALAYVTNRAIQNRLDETFGVFGWKNEFHAWKNNGQLCGISVKYGDEWITKFDGADDSNMEATKGGLSDAMKRAAYQWGIGRYLYNLPAVWMPIEKRGNSYVLSKMPILPKWALPEGCEPEPERVTTAQLKQIKEAADDAGVDKTSLLEIAKDMFGVTDSKVLTGDQAYQLEAKLKEMKEAV